MRYSWIPKKIPTRTVETEDLNSNFYYLCKKKREKENKRGGERERDRETEERKDESR